MAFAHIHFDQSSQYGNKLRAVLTKMEQGDDEFADIRDVMVQMRDGADNAGDSSNYAELVRRFGFGGYAPTQGAPTQAQTDLARAAFLEIDSAYFKTSTNDAVSNVRAARDQLFGKLR